MLTGIQADKNIKVLTENPTDGNNIYLQYSNGKIRFLQF